MRIFPDTRDLINLLQYDQPTSAQRFEDYLLAGNHQIVLSFMNVWELAGPLAEGAEFMELRHLFQSLERMPHICIRTVGVFGDEIQAALGAFTNGTAYQAPMPYVQRWDATLESMPGQRFPSTVDMLILKLDEIVYLMSRSNPGLFKVDPNHTASLQVQFQNDRVQLRARQAPARDHFIHTIRNHAATRGINLPRGREDEFAGWIYSDPNRCPGLRLNHEVYRALMQNYTDIPERGDFADLAHIGLIPYVDAATLDRRMRNYCNFAARELSKAGATVDYAGRVYEDLHDFMRMNP